MRTIENLFGGVEAGRLIGWRKHERVSAERKREMIELVGRAPQPKRATIAALDLTRSTFYRWQRRDRDQGEARCRIATPGYPPERARPSVRRWASSSGEMPRRGTASQATCSAIIRTECARQSQAPAAGAFVLRGAGTHRVGAVAADEPPVLVGDHRSEVDARHAILAPNGQDRISWHWALPHVSKAWARRSPDVQPSDPTVRT
jgi:transposase-like protein